MLFSGSISREQFCQILLIYIGTAADIVEFSEIYKDDDVQKLSKDTESVLHGCMSVWALSVVQFSLTIALPEDGLKEDEEEEEEGNENEYERMSYFRTAKLQNKVAPMSYMQYKSLLREGMNNDGDGTQLTSRRTARSNWSFQDKYPKLNFDTVKPAGLEPIAGSPQRGRTETSPTYFSNLSNNTSNTNNGTSNGSLSQRSETWSAKNGAERVKKISLPHGGRTPMNIGSPPPPMRSVASPPSGRSKKSSVTSRPVIVADKRPSSKESTQSGSSSRQKNFSKDSQQERPPIKSWDSLLERMPWSMKRRRRDTDTPVTIQRKDSTKEDNSLGIGKKEVKGCFYKYLDLIAILLPVCMQDGPFFIVRLVLVARYNIVTDMIPILITKNALVIIVNIYRILIIYCSEPPKDHNAELDDPSTRVRAAMDTNQKLSNRNSFRAKRASIAVQALSRMQTRLFGKEDKTVLRQTRLNEHDFDSPA